MTVTAIPCQTEQPAFVVERYGLASAPPIPRKRGFRTADRRSQLGYPGFRIGFAIANFRESSRSRIREFSTPIYAGSRPGILSRILIPLKLQWKKP